MSNANTSPDHSQPHPDLSALAVSLQEAAKALLAVSPMDTPDVPPIAPKDAPSNPPTCKNGGETRSFYFPAGEVRLEKDLLQKYRADDF